LFRLHRPNGHTFDDRHIPICSEPVTQNRSRRWPVVQVTNEGVFVLRLTGRVIMSEGCADPAKLGPFALWEGSEGAKRTLCCAAEAAIAPRTTFSTRVSLQQILAIFRPAVCRRIADSWHSSASRIATFDGRR